MTEQTSEPSTEATSPADEDSATAQLGTHTTQACAAIDHVQVSADGSGTPVLEVPLAEWHTLAAALHQAGFSYFDWLSAVDQPDQDPAGVDLVAHLVCLAESGVRERVLIRTRVPDGQAAATVVDLWPGAAWHERETFEMFGISFTGFAEAAGEELRPLLLPDGFEGTPLRKSFQLTARASKPWPGAKDPGESDAKPARAPGRRKTTPPGVPDAEWGPRPFREPEPEPESAPQPDTDGRPAANAEVAE